MLRSDYNTAWHAIPGARCHICGAQIYSRTSGDTLDDLLLWQRHGDTGGYLSWRSLDPDCVVDAGMWPAHDSPEYGFERRAHNIDGAVDAFGVVHFMGIR